MATVREQLEAKYGTPTTKSPVVSRETPAVSIRAQLEAKYKKPKTYAEQSAEMMAKGEAVGTRGRFNRTGEITPSLGGNIVRGIARIPVEGALTVALTIFPPRLGIYPSNVSRCSIGCYFREICKRKNGIYPEKTRRESGTIYSWWSSD